LQVEDSDCKVERKYVYAIQKDQYNKYPLIVKDIRKVYPGVNGRAPKVANKNITVSVKSGELFGLLGPNGAGKTTLISQLTGLYAPTMGNAWIGGFSVKSQLEIVQL
jgi:ABC-type multidrug transport system ATPase subunit